VLPRRITVCLRVFCTCHSSCIPLLKLQALHKLGAIRPKPWDHGLGACPRMTPNNGTFPKSQLHRGRTIEDRDGGS